MVPKEIICSICKKAHALNLEFKHDEKLNLLCYYCGKPMFATNEEDDKKIKNSLFSVSSYLKKEPLPIRQFSTVFEPEVVEEVEVVKAVSDDDDTSMPMFF